MTAQPMKRYKNHAEATADQLEREQHVPKVGELAPDFELTDTKGEGRFCLSQACQSSPVALIFGSYT